MKRKLFPSLIVFALFGLAQVSHAETTYSWRAEATDGTWQLADNWWDGAATATPAGSEILSFDNDAQVTMTNDLTATTRHQIIFKSGVTVSRTIAGATQNAFVAVAADAPMIRNDSAVGHALNFPMLIDTDNLVLHAATGPLTIGGDITGMAGLLKKGADIVTLSGNNSFTGKTSVTAGTLSINADSRLGDAPGSYVADQLTLDGGTLNITGAGATIGVNRGITIGATGATLTNPSMAGGATASFNSIISGNGPLALRSNGNTSDTGGGVGGSLNLANTANTFTGDITINAGVVNFAGDGSFGNAANDIILAGGGLVATDNRTLPATRDIVLAGGGDRIFRAYGSVTFTIDGAITGTGNVRHTDGGTLKLNAANSFTGNMISAAGSGRIIALGGGNTYTGYTFITNSSTLRLDADNVLPDTTGVLMYGGTTFNGNGRSDTLRGLYVGGSLDTTATINLGATGSTGTLTITNNSMVAGAPTSAGGSLYAKITGFGSLEYNHASSDTALWDWLNIANDFTGNIVVTRGRLRSNLNGGAGSFGNLANDIIFNGDVVTTLGNGEGKASIQGASSGALNFGVDRSIILNSGKEGTMYVWGGNTYTVAGQITGGGNLRKEDGGVLLLNNTSNDYSGLTRIASGSIRVGVNGVIPDASSVEIAGGNLDLNNVGETVASLFGTGGAVNGGNTLTVLTSGSADYSGSIQTATTLRMSGTGTQTLSGTGDNSDGRARVDSGTLVLAKASALSVHAVGTNSVVGLTIAGGTARLGGTGDDQIYSYTLVDQSAGVFDFNGTNESFRALAGSGGTVRNDAASTTRTITLGETAIGTNTFSYSGNLEDGAGTLALTKVGLGVQILNGTNTYTGATKVLDGTLAVASAYLSDSATVSISATGVLQLDHSDTDVVGGLVFGGVAQPNGIYSSANSGGRISGTGKLKFNNPAYSYSAWADNNGISGEPATGDFDNDGLSNIVEYALGLDPKVSSVPAGTFDGTTLSFNKGTDAIAGGDVDYIIETSSDLGVSDPWAAVVTQAAPNAETSISYNLPQAGPKLFARLKIVKVP